jgi:hypothetical protein
MGNMEILIFKTDVTSKRKAGKVGFLLKPVKLIKQWTVDLEDCDKVLRVVGTGLSPNFVESLLHSAGFKCQVMDY